jgi:hypothetical protein
LFLALLIAGCGGGGGTGKTTPDMAKKPAGDMAMAPDCGTVGKACCENDMCTEGTCQSGMCVMMAGADTGAPCTKAADCGGKKPVCRQQDPMGYTWPGGYCQAPCNPAKNDQDGLNPDCPGQGVCIGQGANGGCYSACTDKMGQFPCRMGYACFNAGGGLAPVCLPDKASECDPLKKGSCPQDGGVFLPTDGGMVYSGRTCVQVGPDPVGGCLNGCNPFVQNCPKNMGGADQACFATFQFGEGICAAPFLSGGSKGMNGDPCMYLNGCAPGFQCRSEGMAGKCRPFCGGPKNVACPMGLKCNDLNMNVKMATLGLCGP